MNTYLKSKLTNFRIVIIYYITILLLTSYATYKNGMIIYNKNLIDFIGVFKPILLVISSIVISYLVSYIYYKVIKKENYNFKDDYSPIFMSLIILTLPLNVNIYIYIIAIILFSVAKIFYKFDCFNYYAIIKLIIILLLILIGKYSYSTLYDLNVETLFSTLDLFLGRGIGGIATTNILLIIICYLVLLLNNSYKKNIPIISLISYLIVLIIFDLLFNKNIIFDIKNLICSEFLYGVVFISTISFYSPIKIKEKIIYAIFIGILSFVFNNIFNIYEGVFIAILFSNLILIGYEKLERVILNEHK